MSPGGSDEDACSRDAPCKSFSAAYRAATPGEVVEVAGGSYPAQTIEHDPAKQSSEDVYLLPASAASVTVEGDILVYGSHLTLAGMAARDTDVPYDGPTSVADVTLWNMDARTFTIDSGQDIRVLGGDYGPASSCGGSYGGGNNGIRRNRPEMPQNILIDGVDFHDIQSHDLIRCHIECLIVGAAQRLTVRNSRFWGCSIFDIFFQPFNGPISDVTLENNWFAAPTGVDGQVNSARGVEFSGGGPWNDILIRHNSFNTRINLDESTASAIYNNVRVVGNIAAGGCYAGSTYRYNVWRSGACHSTDRSLSGGRFPFVAPSNTGNLDYHLTGGVARDLIPARASDLVDDIDGQTRPLGKLRDAGADEMR